jgi:putative transposase
MHRSFCIAALREALACYGVPHIFNTDQGSQFTSDDFVGELRENHIMISMDGKGGLWTTCMSSGSGGVSNTKTST